MDSRIPFTNSHSYIELLSSQQENYYHECFIPPLVSESTEVPLEDEPTAQEKKERRQWLLKDDLVLISAWLNTSKDTVVGNEQKATTFWKRVAKYFAGSHEVAGLEKREPTHCKQRWQKINNQVCKFVGSYEAAKAQKRSGYNDNDYLKLAHELFYNDYKKKFNLEHAWNELKNDQKWCASSMRASGTSKRKKCEEGAGHSSSSHTVNNLEDQIRPPGVKAAKSKGKKNGETETSTLMMFESMWEIKKQDLVMKQNISKTTLLESLIAKQDLCDEEKALKKHLITEMMNKGL